MFENYDHVRGPAVIYTGGILTESNGKTAHGLIRGTERFKILGVIDPPCAGKDAGVVLDGIHRNIPVYADVRDFLKKCPKKPQYLIFGVAPCGGLLPDDMRPPLLDAMQHGLSLVFGLHQYLSEDADFQAAAQKYGVKIYDVRRPRPFKDLRFFRGEIFSVKTPRIALLGMDCAVGKRTTGRFLVEMCRKHNIKAEMIFTGQTGWMQGCRHGFFFDTTPNDFVSGELERCIVECDQEAKPDIIFIEGQSSLRNPFGPSGSEILLSGQAKAAILMHAPFRKYFEETELPQCLIPSVETEIELIKMYGAQTLAVALNGAHGDRRQLIEVQKNLTQKLNCPVIRPLEEGVEMLLSLIRDYINQQTGV